MSKLFWLVSLALAFVANSRGVSLWRMFLFGRRSNPIVAGMSEQVHAQISKVAAVVCDA